MHETCTKHAQKFLCVRTLISGTVVRLVPEARVIGASGRALVGYTSADRLYLAKVSAMMARYSACAARNGPRSGTCNREHKSFNAVTAALVMSQRIASLYDQGGRKVNACRRQKRNIALKKLQRQCYTQRCHTQRQQRSRRPVPALAAPVAPLRFEPQIDRLKEKQISFEQQ